MEPQDRKTETSFSLWTEIKQHPFRVSLSLLGLLGFVGMGLTNGERISETYESIILLISFFMLIQVMISIKPMQWVQGILLLLVLVLGTVGISYVVIQIIQ